MGFYYSPSATRQLAQLAALSLLAFTSQAQAPTWSGVAYGTTPKFSMVQAVATDASGNVFVTGYFIGTVTFGSTLLTSVGTGDLFVAKYVPTTDTWA